MKITIVQCATCSKSVSKPTKEVKRRLKESHVKFYCNNSCSIRDIPRMLEGNGNINNIPEDKRRVKITEYSPFKYYMSRTKFGSAGKFHGPSNLTLEYLKQLWDTQAGLCPYTGYAMELPKDAKARDFKSRTKRASLDRIDSSKGYLQGNVEFVCLSANFAKNNCSKEELLEFFQPLRNANIASLPVLTVV